MKKIITSFHLMLFTLTALMPLVGCANPSATIKVRIINEKGEPIKDVQSQLINIYDYGVVKSGLTDENGFYSDHLKNIFEVSGYFQKSGYYKSSGVIWDAPNKWGDVPPADTNFIVVLKHIINPVPLKYMEVRAFFPRLDEPVGFDLEIGDWVFPDGKGKIADIHLTGKGYCVSEFDYSFHVTVEFLGEHNGIQSFHVPKEGVGALLRSELPPPPIAPETGYEKTFKSFTKRVVSDKWHPISHDETRRWIYRIRTEVDENGEIITANYGWTTQDLKFGIQAAIPGIFVLKYYHNSDPKSHSLEPKEIADNQSKDLPGGED